MKITSVKSFKSKYDGVVCFGSVTIDEQLVLSDITIREGQYGPWPSFPSKKTDKVDENGKPIYREYYFSMSKDFKKDIASAMINALEVDNYTPNPNAPDYTKGLSQSMGIPPAPENELPF